MKINDILETAVKYQELTDFINDSPELKMFKKDVEICANQKINSFADSYTKRLKKIEEFNDVVNNQNRDLLIKLAGIIDVGMDVFSIIELQKNNSYKYTACYGILINSLKIVQEIYCLCSNGFSDGAFSRWRSLFENYITAKLLIVSDEETSEMFLGYETIIKQKRINDFNKITNTVDSKNIQEEYNKLIQKYPKDYTKPNGWLIKKFPNQDDRTFAKLVENVGCSEWLFFYRMSCDYLHSNAFSAFESLGKENFKLPMGPFETGIELPINLTITFTIYLLTKLVEEFQGKNYVGVFLMDYLLKTLEVLNLNEQGIASYKL